MVLCMHLRIFPVPTGAPWSAQRRPGGAANLLNKKGGGGQKWHQMSAHNGSIKEALLGPSLGVFTESRHRPLPILRKRRRNVPFRCTEGFKPSCHYTA